MANFKTHIQVATVVSAVASSALLDFGILSWQQATCCWIAGSLGGILPDIDSDNSHSLDILFRLLSAILCLVIMVSLSGHFSLPYIWGGVVSAYVILNTIVRKIFERLTVHRGIFHSVLMGLFFAALCINGAHFAQAGDKLSWFLGLFLTLGFFVHLLLDEIYAIDLKGMRFKRSFGTAFKIYDYNNVAVSAFFFSLLCVNGYFLPSYKPMFHDLTTLVG